MLVCWLVGCLVGCWCDFLILFVSFVCLLVSWLFGCCCCCCDFLILVVGCLVVGVVVVAVVADLLILW